MHCLFFRVLIIVVACNCRLNGFTAATPLTPSHPHMHTYRYTRRRRRTHTHTHTHTRTCTPVSTECLTGWTMVGKRCFKYDETRRNYEDSVKYCISQGAQIASIHNDKENDAVTSMIPADIVAYLGAESDGKGNWKWRDGSAWWQPGPAGLSDQGLRGVEETHIAIHNDGRGNTPWHDWSGGESQIRVVCATTAGSTAKPPGDHLGPMYSPLCNLLTMQWF